MSPCVCSQLGQAIEMGALLETRLRVIISQGLTEGLGDPTPGGLCVEAAVCLARGEPHSDRSVCVGEPQRLYSIAINDADWSSDQARAEGLVDWAVEHLDSADLSEARQNVFVERLAELTIRRVLPIALRVMGLHAAADRCEREGTAAAARHAFETAQAAAKHDTVSHASLDCALAVTPRPDGFHGAHAALAARAAVCTAEAAAVTLAVGGRIREANLAADNVLRTSVACAREALRYARDSWR